MIFQDPMTSLNPFLTVAEQLTEVTRPAHGAHTRRQALDHAPFDMLERVGIPAAAERIMVLPARVLRRDAATGDDRHGALSCKPDVLIADEPTTALGRNDLRHRFWS